MNVSSALIYGAQSWEVKAMAETYSGGLLDCSSMLSSYAEAKRVGETLVAAYRNEHRLPIVNKIPRPDPNSGGGSQASGSSL